MPSPKPPSPTPLQKPIPPNVPAAEIRHVQSLPMAQPTLNDPQFKVMSMSRALTHGGRGHTLMASTWNTEATIGHLVSFYRRSATLTSSPSDHTDTDALDVDLETRTEVRRFYTFGSGLNAHPDLLHGGVIACILDSTMGNVIGVAMPTGNADPKGDSAPSASMFTAQLNVKYEKPVTTPGSVMARSWVRRVEEGGRKVWVEGVVEGVKGEDGKVRHAWAEGLWVRAEGRKKLKSGGEGVGDRGKL